MSCIIHLHDDLSQNKDRVSVTTRHGPVTGGRASNGAIVFLEIPYALPPKRFSDPEPLPSDHRYEEREYIKETSYAVQPNNDGQAAHVPFTNKVGLGQPSENPLFLNIYIPPSFPSQKGFPVKVYIHGGFLQFGSPHGVSAQAHYVAAERSEVWVNIGYRVSAFGFVASDQPRLTGNYGFKDQWLALQWVKLNIESFGGDPGNIQLQGLSAGAHSVHQQLFKVSYLPEGQKAPFRSAVLRSNAIMTDPKTPEELRLQFRALCKALELDPDSPDILDVLRDTVKVPWTKITKAIETDALGVQYGTFRGCLSSDWISTSPGPMEMQRSGEFARCLRERGVHSIAVGEVVDEWYIYSLSHPISSTRDIGPNLTRYFSEAFVEKLMQCFRKLPEDASQEDATKLFGEIMSSGFPVLRYNIEWVPEESLVEGYVTHACDKSLWTLSIPSMTADELNIARNWLKTFYDEVDGLKADDSHSMREPSVVLKLTKDRAVEWCVDKGYDDLLSKF
ncbi:hypothetical protein APHAL10511_000608 [Amanita phalloides]|nr:hypothetical protein APHAL10511_000608 [Amanita phalloides]